MVKRIAIFLALSLTILSHAIAAESDPSRRPTKEAYLRLAGEAEANLRKEILEKFFPLAADEQGGGLFENYGLDWTRLPGGNKSIVYQSRLTWTSAAAAGRFPTDREIYLAMTRRGAACLWTSLWDKELGGFHWAIDSAGKPASDIKQIYGNAFGMYALAESYRATKDDAALDQTKKAFAWLEAHAHDDQNKGYFEAIGSDGKPSATGGSVIGARGDQKSMNTSIHLLEALTGVYQAWPDPAVKQRLAEMLDICLHKVYAEPGYLTQFFTADWQRTPSADSFGHDVEAGFLMVEAAQVLGDENPRIWTAARQLVDHALQYGFDDARGGLYDSGAINGQGVVAGNIRTDKIWWVQAEQLNALLLLHERFGNQTPRYWDAYIKQWDWITRFQIDHNNGGWWATVHADGTPASRVKADMWTECYHQARAMLNVSERLRNLASH